MQDFKDKVAVVTGAASGLGRAIAERCSAEQMRVVLADSDADALAQTEQALASTGVAVLAVQTDVTQAANLEALAQKTLDAYGAVHLLVNNAGVILSKPTWDTRQPIGNGCWE